jgi:hypothetical protein
MWIMATGMTGSNNLAKPFPAAATHHEDMIQRVHPQRSMIDGEADRRLRRSDPLRGHAG